MMTHAILRSPSRRKCGSCILALLLLLLLSQSSEVQGTELLDLQADTFESTLKQFSPSQPAFVLFYAHWCPACNGFMPYFEKAAAELTKMTDPEVVIGRLDCAEHKDTCAHFEVKGYPSMRFGTVEQFLLEKPTAQDVVVPNRNKDTLAEVQRLIALYVSYTSNPPLLLFVV